MDIEQRNEIIASMIGTAQGRQKLASTMTSPLRRRRDYESVARKAFFVEPLPNGALPIYDKDVEVDAFYIGEGGANIVTQCKSQRISCPIFDIAANPEIALSEIQSRRFDTVQRALDKAKIEIQVKEDSRVFALMNAAAEDPSNPNADLAVTGNLTSAALSDAFANIERHDMRVAYVFMNAKDYADIRKFDRDILDTKTQGELLRTGLMGTIWGAKFIISRIVPAGTIYVTGEPEFFGRMPIRMDLTVLSADDPKARIIGFSVFESLGIVLFNPYAQQRILLSRS